MRSVHTVTAIHHPRQRVQDVITIPLRRQRIQQRWDACGSMAAQHHGRTDVLGIARIPRRGAGAVTESVVVVPGGHQRIMPVQLGRHAPRILERVEHAVQDQLRGMIALRRITEVAQRKRGIDFGQRQVACCWLKPGRQGS
nr:hypothetical protein [Paenarthrobacter sp. Z7-10]